MCILVTDSRVLIVFNAIPFKPDLRSEQLYNLFKSNMMIEL